jgi:GTP-binding protein HflX
MARPLYNSEEPVETVMVVGIQQGRTPAWEVSDGLDELAMLCGTAGAQVRERIICKLGRIHPSTYVGTGKAQELADAVKTLGISTVVFDDDLSAAQGRNLEKIFGTKVIDRTQVILDIFAQRARSHEGRMQIELAQLEYLLPRLRRMWTHLERQKGGIGMHGPGEKQLELDRRRIVERIDRFKDDLDKVRGHRAEQRRGRRRHGWALVSLVGYTNAGKSTLLNQLTGADVMADDLLFATLDPTTRQLRLAQHQQVLLTDTVGFIRKLPHGLVDAFKATLEEVNQADLLLHVVDVSHPRVEQQVEAVQEVLRELGAHEKPLVYVLNKSDLPEAAAMSQVLRERLTPSVVVSALRGTGLDHLRDVLADQLRHRHQRMHLRVPHTEGRLLASLRNLGSVFALSYEDEATVLDVAVPPRLAAACEPYRIDSETPPVE